MDNFDDLFEQPSGGKPFDKQAWAAQKQAERKSVFELADTTACEVGRDGERFRSYLDVQATFDRYSPTNALLILAQRPDATQLRSFDGWRAQEVSIKRGQTHIKILEPGEEYRREDGSIGTSWQVKHVFDIAQTNARPDRIGTIPPDSRTLLKALIHKAPVPIVAVDELPNRMGAYYDHDQQQIFVRRGMEAVDIFRSLSNELAHAQLALSQQDYHRGEAGFAAYSVSYILCRRNGVDVGGYSFSRLPESLTTADAKGVREALTEIADTAKTISGRMNRALEQAKPPRAKGQER